MRNMMVIMRRARTIVIGAATVMMSAGLGMVYCVGVCSAIGGEEAEVGSAVDLIDDELVAAEV
jgi:hypothetical protein